MLLAGFVYEVRIDGYIATGAISRGSYEKGATVDSMAGRIMTENVSVSSVPSTDTTVQSGSGFVGYLVVYVRHNGSDKDTKVYVNLDIRNCEKGYRSLYLTAYSRRLKRNCRIFFLQIQSSTHRMHISISSIRMS